MEIKKILVPLDLTNASPKIIPHVRTVAQKFGAQVHILFVVQTFKEFSGVGVSNTSLDNFETQIAEGAKKRLEEFKNEYFSFLSDVQTAIAFGDVSEEILKYVGSHDINLLVVGRYSKKDAEKTFVGSVADRVLKSSPIPVLVVNPYS